MADKAYAIVILLRWLVVLICFTTLITIFVYTPYYARSVLWLLDRYVDVEINPIAAQSQKSGQLSMDNNLEPGSPEWVARRAYLYEVNRALNSENAHHFVQLQQRYQLLLEMIEEQKKIKLDQSLNLSPTEIQDPELSETSKSSQISDFLGKFEQDENESLFQQYREFLTQNEHLFHLTQISKEIDRKISESTNVMQRPAHQPHAIVILGGGLTTGPNKSLMVNAYTQKRLELAVEVYKKNHLPIVLSGVEAPYMQQWLEQHAIQAQFLENRSMNTCENTRFSSLLLQKQGGAPTVFLVTDAYHMPRSQRLFAINGIATIPVIAPLPNALTQWQPNRQNLMHSRRATYEILATLRDLWFGESNCREIP